MSEAWSKLRAAFQVHAERYANVKNDEAKALIADVAAHELLKAADPSLNPDRRSEHVGWRPISEAPWSGPPVLLWKEGTKEHYVAARISGAHGPGWCTPDGYQIFGATHWHPLPAPPSPHPLGTENGL